MCLAGLLHSDIWIQELSQHFLQSLEWIRVYGQNSKLKHLCKTFKTKHNEVNCSKKQFVKTPRQKLGEDTVIYGITQVTFGHGNDDTKLYLLEEAASSIKKPLEDNGKSCKAAKRAGKRKRKAVEAAMKAATEKVTDSTKAATQAMACCL